MTRGWLFVPLFLATGSLLLGDVSGATPAAGAVERQAKVRVSEDESARDVAAAAGRTVAAGAKAKDEEPGTENAEGDEKKQTQTKQGAKEISGMSILGNQEAPKSLVIVPWKSSVLGGSLGISTMLDDSRQPVDKEVFMRALTYYEIRSETRP